MTGAAPCFDEEAAPTPNTTQTSCPQADVEPRNTRFETQETHMKDLMGMMKQVKDMQERMQKMQAELQETEVEGHSGGGLVKITLNGKGDVRRVSIDPTLLKPEEAEILEDLIVAAAQDAKSKVEAMMQEKMAEATGGLPLPPGMKLF